MEAGGSFTAGIRRKVRCLVRYSCFFKVGGRYVSSSQELAVCGGGSGRGCEYMPSFLASLHDPSEDCPIDGRRRMEEGDADVIRGGTVAAPAQNE